MAEVTPSGSGGPITLSGPAQDGPLSIRGGIGGISFQLEELTGGAEKLDDLAGKLSRLELDMRRIWEDLCPYQDLPRWSGVMALSMVRESERSVWAVRTELQAISSQVRACRQQYEFAEGYAGAARFFGLSSIGDIGNSLVDVATTGALDRRTMETLVSELGLAAHDLKRRVGWDPSVWYALEQAGVFSRPLDMQQEETVHVDLDPSPAGLLERIRMIDARGAGFIEVIEVSNGGEKAFVVVVPGTQFEGPGSDGDNPLDEAGIVDAMLYNSDEMSIAARQALQAAGAEQGAAVVAVGYSQGGIHAMNLAADPLFLREYNLRYVLTAGSPVAGITPVPGVQSLHLEHRGDWVPGSDGAPNPDTRDRVTVSLTNTPRALKGEGGIGRGHTLSTYQDGARLVSASGDPSLVGSTAALGAVLGAGGPAAATRFFLTRAKAPAVPSVAVAAGPRKYERGHAGR